MSHSPHTFVTVVTLGLALCLCDFTSADDSKPERKRLPKSGMLAASSISGASNTVVGDVFGGEDIFGPELPPISGSVARLSESVWRFSVMNNSQDRYTVNVDLIQKDENGSTVKFGSYTYTLRPGQSDGEEVAAGLDVQRAELNLRSYRNLTEQEELRKAKK